MQQEEPSHNEKSSLVIISLSQGSKAAMSAQDQESSQSGTRVSSLFFALALATTKRINWPLREYS